jgi:hypothetical protein
VQLVLANHQLLTHHHAQKAQNVVTHYQKTNGISLGAFNENLNENESENKSESS